MVMSKVQDYKELMLSYFKRLVKLQFTMSELDKGNFHKYSRYQGAHRDQVRLQISF